MGQKLKTQENEICTLRASDVLVVCSFPELENEARQKAACLGSHFLPDSASLASDQPLWLELSPQGLSLTDGKMGMQGDFLESFPRLKQHLLGQELLVKAARIKGFEGAPRLVDATAGLGADSLLLAAAGFNVTMFESNPVVALLLEDALRRAQQDERLADIVARMTLVCGDSVAGMGDLEEAPDVILLDPMFPARKKSAQVKKKFQLIHCLEAPCTNEEELFAAAVAAQPRKIVVKRPPKGPYLADNKPAYSIQGKAVRYDCYVFAK